MIIWNYSGIKSEKKCNLGIILDDLNYFSKALHRRWRKAFVYIQEKLHFEEIHYTNFIFFRKYSIF